MRVVFCVYGYAPEVEPLQPWLTVREVAAVLLAEGWEVHIVTDVHATPTLAGLVHHYIKTMRPSHSDKMLQLLSEIAPDTVVMLATPLNLASASWYKSVKCPLIAFLSYPFYNLLEYMRAIPHLSQDELRTYGRHALIPKHIWGRTLRKYFSAVVSQSPRTAERVGSAAGKSVATCAIDAGVDLDFWQPAESLPSPAGNEINFLYVGSPKRIRGFYLLLEAFRGLKGLAVTLRVLARSSMPDEVAELRREIDSRLGVMAEKVEVVGGWIGREEYREELRSADIVVLPFVLVPSELPVSVIECIATGTPVIATNIDGLPDAVGTGGMIVRSGSVSSLRGAMKSLVGHPDRIERLREGCRETRNTMTGWPDVGQKWLRLLFAG